MEVKGKQRQEVSLLEEPERLLIEVIVWASVGIQSGKTSGIFRIGISPTLLAE